MTIPLCFARLAFGGGPGVRLEVKRQRGKQYDISITGSSFGWKSILKKFVKNKDLNPFYGVFGSVARGEEEESDIDLLVEMEPGRSLLDHAALWLELQEVMGRKVDVVSDRGIKDRNRERVLREAVPL